MKRVKDKTEYRNACER